MRKLQGKILFFYVFKNLDQLVNIVQPVLMYL